MDVKIIGVDFSVQAISMAVVTFGRGEQRVAACERVPLDGNGEWPGLAEALARIQETVDFRDALCVVSFPDDDIFYRIISMPFSDRKKIAKVIAYELEPLLPFALEDAIIDFQPAAASRLSDSGTDFFVAAAFKPRLREFIGKLNALGLEPEIITSRAFAAVSVLSAYKDNGIFADGDPRRLTVGGFAGGGVRFVHTMMTGNADQIRPKAVADTLNHILIADEERQASDFHPGTVFLTDILYRIPGMKETVAPAPGISVGPLDMAGLAGLAPAGSAAAVNGEAGGCEIALCLALLKRVSRPVINFRKDELAVTGKWRQYSNVMVRTGLIAALVMAIGLFGFYYDLKTGRDRIAAVDARMAAIFRESFPDVPLVDEPLVQMRMEFDRLKGKSGLPAEMSRKAYCIDILNDISRFVPPDNDVIIEKLSIGPDDVILSGSTDSFNAVDALKSEFGKSVFLSKIDISSATMSKVDKRVSFKLRLELQ
ncbi:MAG: pilus assembly protein PilM [Thermodesulfobacteriota bacterium]